METAEIVNNFLIQTVFPVLGTLLLVLVNYAIYEFAKKYKIEAVLDNMHRIEFLAEDAVHFAEEWALKKVKVGDQITSNDKLNMAVIWLLKRSPEIDRDDAKEWIESALNRIRQNDE